MAGMTATVWVLGDQLLLNHPAISNAEERFGKENIIVLMIESESRTRRYPYQRKKLVLLFSAMRHYAGKLRAEGFEVDYWFASKTNSALQEHIREYSPEAIFMMEANESQRRKFQHQTEEQLTIPATVLPNTQILVGRFDPFPDAEGDKRYVHEQFYWKMRKHFDLLMQPDGSPVGDNWNYDKSNRLRLPNEAQPPLPNFVVPDEITLEVMDEVEEKFQGVGKVSGFDLAVSREQVQLAVDDFLTHRLPDFGSYEDAMSNTSEILGWQLHRWRYSQPKHLADAPFFKIKPLPPIYFAGDAFGGARVEGTAVSGLAAGPDLLNYLEK